MRANLEPSYTLDFCSRSTLNFENENSFSTTVFLINRHGFVLSKDLRSENGECFLLYKASITAKNRENCCSLLSTADFEGFCEENGNFSSSSVLSNIFSNANLTISLNNKATGVCSHLSMSIVSIVSKLSQLYQLSQVRQTLYVIVIAVGFVEKSLNASCLSKACNGSNVYNVCNAHDKHKEPFIHLRKRQCPNKKLVNVANVLLKMSWNNKARSNCEFTFNYDFDYDRSRSLRCSIFDSKTSNTNLSHLALLLHRCGDVHENPGPDPAQTTQPGGPDLRRGHGGLGGDRQQGGRKANVRPDLLILTYNVRGLGEAKKVRHLINKCY